MRKILKSFIIVAGILLIGFTYDFYSIRMHKFFFDELEEAGHQISDKPILLRSRTNFKWDYAILHTGEDFQNIEFFKNNQVIYEDKIKLHSDGSFKTQVLFQVELIALTTKEKFNLQKKWN